MRMRVSAAIRTLVKQKFRQLVAYFFTRYLHESQPRHIEHARFYPVVKNATFKFVDHLQFMLVGYHIYKIDYDNTAYVSQSYLTRNFPCGFHIRKENRFFVVALTAESARIYVYRRKGFGLVDYERTARRKRDFPLQKQIEFAAYTEYVHHIVIAFVILNLIAERRFLLFEILLKPLYGVVVVAYHRIYIVRQHIAHRAEKQITFRVNGRNAYRRVERRFYIGILTAQALGFAQNFAFLRVGANGSRNKSFFPDSELFKQAAQLIALILVRYLVGNTDKIERGQVNHVAPRKRQVHRKARSFRLRFFFRNLNHNEVAFFNMELLRNYAALAQIALIVERFADV